MKKIFSIFFLCLLFACSSKDKSIQVISDETLISILISMHLIDATTQTHNVLTTDKIFIPQNYYDSVLFNTHSITDSMFRASIEQHTLKGTIGAIYSAVIDSLQTRKIPLEYSEKKERNTDSKH